MRDRTEVDAGIDEQAESGWEFDEQVAEQFDDHVRKSIPNYSTIQTQTVKLTDWFTRTDDESVIYDLGCATGETLKLLCQHHRGDDISLVGLDVEPAMLEKAREKTAGNDRVRLTQRDLRRHQQYPDATVVVSLFTLSFLPEDDRAALLDAVYRDLDRGGALIFCEKTRATTAWAQDIFTEHYWDYKSERGLDDGQILDKARTLRGQLRPLTEAEYREMLVSAGFDEDDIEVWYRYYPWLGVVARKR